MTAERLKELLASLGQKARGEKNSVGDVWGDWVCEDAAAAIEALIARIEEVVAENERLKAQLREMD
jgi:hypothetical protein